MANLTGGRQRTFVRARRTHLAGVRELFLDRCSEEESAMLVALLERLLPGCTTWRSFEGAPGECTVRTEGADRIGGGGDLDAPIAYLTAGGSVHGPALNRATPIP